MSANQSATSPPGATTADGTIDDMVERAMSRLEGSGEKDRLLSSIRYKLDECGWSTKLREYAAHTIRERGVDNVTVEEVVKLVAPIAKNHVPETVKDEVSNQIRIFLARELKNLK